MLVWLGLAQGSIYCPGDAKGTLARGRLLTFAIQSKPESVKKVAGSVKRLPRPSEITVCPMLELVIGASSSRCSRANSMILLRSQKASVTHLRGLSLLSRLINSR